MARFRGYRFEVGFLIDQLTATMMLVVTFVSLMVSRFTQSVICTATRGITDSSATSHCFTFSMLMLVMSNNFMQLFFGWEAVGLALYLLIGFWYTQGQRQFWQT